MNSRPMAALPSLRRELVRTLTLVSGVWLLAVFLAMAFGIRHEVDDLMDDALQESAEVLYGTLVLHGYDWRSEPDGILPAPPHDERLVWQIVDDAGRVVLRSHKAPALALLPAFRSGASDAPDHWRVYAIRLPDARRFLVVGQPRFERLEARYEVITMVGLSGLLVGGVCALWMRWRVMRVMRELQDLSAQIQMYDPMRPQTDLPVATRQEFVPVREAVLDLGQRLERRVANEQAFAAHAAHALRTPLAGMDAQLAMAMKEVDGPARPRIERTREAVARLKRVITALLALFRSQATLDLQPIDVAQMLSHLSVDPLQVHCTQDQPLLADPDLIAAALANLLDNAWRHGARTCWVSVHTQGRQQRLSLRDDGPGVDAQRLAQLQDSVDQTEAGQIVGLGLKLAGLVARAHHGRLVLGPADPARPGFVVSLVLEPPQADATQKS
ncbi:MAG: HAMP domain-containing histidine kinase [Rhodoferax sp.]|jgi:signal transduction histidine kinase|nr:HAMP domain-containing histidine kinase [Rhodoferax sp.]